MFESRRPDHSSRPRISSLKLSRHAIVVAACILAACGNGGPTSGGVAQRADVPLPPFTAFSTDLPDPTEGTAANPLSLAWNPACVFGGVFPECDAPFAVPAWPQSNAIATTRDSFRWRTVVNLEPAYDTSCNTGPPDQSLALGVHPITWLPDPAGRSVQFGFELANEAALCSKAPYVAVAYVRGVQGDSQRSLLAWGRQAKLAMTLHTERSPDLPTHVRHVYMYLHFRDAAGKRYMAHRVLWASWAYPADFAYAWNWAETHSYAFAGRGNGPFLHGGAAGCDDAVRSADLAGRTRWTIDVEGLGRCRFPEFDLLRPDLLGFEIATEGAYIDYVHPTGQPNRLIATLADLELTATH